MPVSNPGRRSTRILETGHHGGLESSDCAGCPLSRGKIEFASYTYDDSDLRPSLAACAGSTRHFQYWFRDTMGGGTQFDTSNAVAVQILP